jgi:hypothetical protein
MILRIHPRHPVAVGRSDVLSGRGRLGAGWIFREMVLAAGQAIAKTRYGRALMEIAG